MLSFSIKCSKRGFCTIKVRIGRKSWWRHYRNQARLLEVLHEVLKGLFKSEVIADEIIECIR